MATGLYQGALYYLTEQASAPATPSAGDAVIYFKTDSLPYYKNEAGTEVAFVATSGAAVGNTQVFYSTSGVATGSANLTFNGTTLTAHTLTVSTGLLTGVNATFSGLLTVTSTSGSNVKLNGRDNGGVDESDISFFKNDGSTYHGLIQGISGTLTFYGGSTLAATFSGANTILAGSLTFNGAGASRATGGLRIGADSTNNLLDDATTGAGTATLYIGNASINVTSDERVKTNVRVWDGDASNLLRSLPVKQFGYSSNAPMGGYAGEYVGFTAQDLHKVAPWAVNTQGDTGLPWAARYEFLTGIMVRGWQEHEARLKALERRN